MTDDHDNWRTDAACRNTPVEVFYPPGSETQRGRPPTPDTRPDPYVWARAICATCPAETVAHCLKEAIDTGDHYGFRAGQTPAELHATINGHDTGNTRECEFCHTPFTLGKFHNMLTRYCSPRCRRDRENERVREWRRARGGRSAA